MADLEHSSDQHMSDDAIAIAADRMISGQDSLIPVHLRSCSRCYSTFAEFVRASAVHVAGREDVSEFMELGRSVAPEARAPYRRKWVGVPIVAAAAMIGIFLMGRGVFTHTLTPEQIQGTNEFKDLYYPLLVESQEDGKADRSIDLDDTQPEFLSSEQRELALTFAYIRMGRIDQANLQLARASELWPNDPLIVVAHAMLDYQANDLGSAVRRLKPIAQEDPTAAFMLARVLIELGEQEGVALLKLIPERWPESIPAERTLRLLEQADESKQ